MAESVADSPKQSLRVKKQEDLKGGFREGGDPLKPVFSFEIASKALTDRIREQVEAVFSDLKGSAYPVISLKVLKQSLAAISQERCMQILNPTLTEYCMNGDDSEKIDTIMTMLRHLHELRRTTSVKPQGRDSRALAIVKSFSKNKPVSETLQLVIELRKKEELKEKKYKLDYIGVMKFTLTKLLEGLLKNKLEEQTAEGMMCALQSFQRSKDQYLSLEGTKVVNTVLGATGGDERVKGYGVRFDEIGKGLSLEDYQRVVKPVVMSYREEALTKNEDRDRKITGKDRPVRLSVDMTATSSEVNEEERLFLRSVSESLIKKKNEEVKRENELGELKKTSIELGVKVKVVEAKKKYDEVQERATEKYSALGLDVEKREAELRLHEKIVQIEMEKEAQLQELEQELAAKLEKIELQWAGECTLEQFQKAGLSEQDFTKYSEISKKADQATEMKQNRDQEDALKLEFLLSVYYASKADMKEPLIDVLDLLDKFKVQVRSGQSPIIARVRDGLSSSPLPVRGSAETHTRKVIEALREERDPEDSEYVEKSLDLKTKMIEMMAEIKMKEGHKSLDGISKAKYVIASVIKSYL